MTTAPLANGSKPCTHGRTIAMRSTQGFVWTLSVFPPRAYVPQHDRARPGLTYIVAGSLREGFFSRNFDIPAGTLIAKPPDAAHWDWSGSKGTTCLILEVAGCNPALLESAPMLDRLALVRSPLMSSLADSVVRRLRRHRSGSESSLSNLTVEFLAAAHHADDYGEHPSWVERAIEFLDDDYMSIKRVNEVAAIAGVHPVHLARVFRRRVGCTIRTYLTRLRVRAAADRLARSDEPISHIAIGVGFADQSHLTRAFTMDLGVAPAQYRAMRRATTVAMLE
jgi:AraC family transcriptional regulator